MSLFGTPIVQSVAGAAHAERVAARDVDRKKGVDPGRAKRGQDEIEINSTQAEDGVRSLKGNGDEETRDDREEQNHYRPQHADDADDGAHPPRPKHIDVQG